MKLPDSNDAIITVEGLHRRFHGTEALCDVSLSVPPGCVFGLVGENGAGKTTLIRHLLGLLRPQSGQVRVFGLDPIAHEKTVLAQCGYLSEDRDMPGWMSVRQLTEFLRHFYDNWDAAYAESLRETFELSATTLLKDLSRGQLAKAGLLAALAHRPQLLILDEPSSGLDPLVRREILTAILRSVAEEGRTVFFSSHLLDEVERVADYVAMLRHGSLVLAGRLDEIREQHCFLQVEGGEGAMPQWPGVLFAHGAGLWTVVAEGDAAAHHAAASAAGYDVRECRGANLEEIFMARAQGAPA